MIFSNPGKFNRNDPHAIKYSLHASTILPTSRLRLFFIFTKLSADPTLRHLTTILSFRRLHSIHPYFSHLILSLISQRLVDVSLSLTIRPNTPVDC